jgi:Ca2+-binding EF-hand superfamily protein
MFKESFRFGDPGEYADYVFDKFDTDQSGTIDFKEFICALNAIDRGSLDERLKCMSLCLKYSIIEIISFLRDIPAV